MATSAPILATRSLGLDIGGARIVADVSLEVSAGEFVGIIGPNGAGKTTLFNLLSGLLRPTAGSVELHGRDITGTPAVPAHPGRPGSHLPGVERLPTPLGAGERRVSPRRPSSVARFGSGGGPHRSARRSSGPSGRWSASACTRGCWPAGLLSHGDKRKLELAMLLAGEPGVILLDEPMAGVSVPRTSTSSSS